MLIGIDLGTTNSLAACYRNGRTEIITNRLGKKIT
ncbi:MAG: Hsp70 family protein, partial [Erysipelotrichaceae bacterium]|nr:Hsp70 family protein [Erysipelotrichaceae bacterium]